MDPSTAALLLIDLQVHFGRAATGLAPRLARLAAAARAAGVPVIWTQHGHPDPAADAAASNLVRWWGPGDSIKIGSPGWRLVGGLGVDEGGGDIVLSEKRTYDAFHGTRLAALLSATGRSALVVGGVLTELCVETTARAAFVRGVDVVVLGDGCGSADPARHAASLAVLGFGFATVATCAEVEAAWAAGNGAG